MTRNLPHSLLSEAMHDEACWQRFVLDLKRIIARQVRLRTSPGEAGQP